MKKIVLAIASVLAGVGLIIGTANAWDFDVSGSGICNTKTGNYDLTWVINNPEPEDATIASSSRASVSGSVNKNSSKNYAESVPGTSTGESLTVELDWPSDSGQPPKTASIDLAGDCKAPEPPKKDTPKETSKKEVPKVEVKQPVVEFTGGGK